MSALSRRIAAAVLAATTAVGLAMPTASATGAGSMSGTAAPPAVESASPSVRQDGPHSPLRRKIAAPKVTRLPGVRVADVDFGDVELGRRKGQFRAPMRGVLVVPEKGRRAPLVVVSHLRMPGCTGDILAYPCPRGSKELRQDRGMTYLGEDLARKGYAVLIPDLAPRTTPMTPMHRAEPSRRQPHSIRPCGESSAALAQSSPGPGVGLKRTSA